MNFPTRDPAGVAAVIASVFARLTDSWRTSANERSPRFSSRPSKVNPATHCYETAHNDLPGVVPANRAATQKPMTNQKTLGRRTRKRFSVVKSNGVRRLKSALAGYVSAGHRSVSVAPQPVAEGLQTLLEWVPAAAIAVDETRTVVQANEAAVSLFGYSVEELSGLSFVQLYPRIADDNQGRSEGAESSASIENLAGRGERRMAIARGKDGSERIVSVKCTQYGAADADLWIITSADWCAQESAGANAPQPEHLARVFELAEMAAVLAHEINQPLTAILSNAQAVQRFPELTRSASSDLRDAFADIVSDSFRATEIVRKLRQFVRRAAPETVPLDIGDLVSGVARMMRRDAIARDVRVILDTGNHAQMVRGDNIQLQQVMINLLQNAFDAVEGRSAEDREVSVKVETTSPGNQVSIAVSDRGPGLKADQIGEVFTPFSTSKPQGLGLGLTISISIISMHGGRLCAESNVHQGATFRILLPTAANSEIPEQGQVS